MKKYYFIIGFSFLSSPCLAYFTDELISYTISVHLYNTIKDKMSTLESQYDEHILAFNERRQKEIEQALKRKLGLLNQFPEPHRRGTEELNANIRLYNTLIIQYEKGNEEQRSIQGKINLVIQKIQEREAIKLKIASVVKNINASALLVNTRVLRLNELTETERKWRDFYNNGGYLSDNSFVQARKDLDQWSVVQNEQWDSKIADYNNAKWNFQKWDENQKQIIERQRAEISEYQEELEQFVEETNTLIVEYNEKIKKRCATKKCKINRSNSKNQNEERRVKIREKNAAIDALISDMNQKEKEYNEEHKKYIEDLSKMKKEITIFHDYWITEQSRKKQILEKMKQAQSTKTEKKWRKAQETLKQFQEELTADYGNNFIQFVEQFSHWMHTNKISLEKITTNSLSRQEAEQLEISNKVLCKKSASPFVTNLQSALPVNQADLQAPESPFRVNPLSSFGAKATEVCHFVNQIFALINTMLNDVVYSEADLEEIRTTFNKKKEEMQDLKERITKLQVESEKLESQLSVQVQKYGERLPEREREYQRMSDALQTELNEQKQKIKTAYEMKYQLLKEEYYLIKYLLFDQDVGEVSVLFKRKWENFRSARENFLAVMPGDIDGFPPKFTQLYEIISIAPKSRDTNFYPIVAFSSSAGNGEDDIKEMEGDKKRSVVFAWMKTDFVSAFLFSTLADRVLGMFVDYNRESNNTAMSAHDGDRQEQIKQDEESRWEESERERAKTQAQAFMKMLFLESVYHDIPIRQVEENKLIRYQITFNDRVFWILPDGQLEAPKGVYQ